MTTPVTRCQAPWTGRVIRVVVALILVLGSGATRGAWAQPAPVVARDVVDGEQVFTQRCASCHTGTTESRAPGLDALKSRTPQAVIESLLTGAMRPQGSRLSGPERRAVAEFVTGKTIGVDVAGAAQGRCAAAPSPAPSSGTSVWSGWSPTVTNTRFQSGEMAGLAAVDVPRLRLKWALGFPDASVAWASPTVAGGRVYVGSQNGTVYSLDAKTGCIYWTFSAAGGVRTAIAVGPSTSTPSAGTPASATRARVYFGDTAANAYALDAETGGVVWTRKVDEHPLARITGSPTLHAGRLYVPVSSYEEAQGADPRYECCTFRGSVSALDAATGRVVWTTTMIRRGRR